MQAPDVTTAQRGSTASVAGTGADDDPSSRRRPSHSSSRSRQIPAVVVRSATAYGTPQTDVHFAVAGEIRRRKVWSALVMRGGGNFPPVPPRCFGRSDAGRWPACA